MLNQAGQNPRTIDVENFKEYCSVFLVQNGLFKCEKVQFRCTVAPVTCAFFCAGSQLSIIILLEFWLTDDCVIKLAPTDSALALPPLLPRFAFLYP